MSDDRSLTVDEIIERIDALSEADYLRLANCRRAWTAGIRGWSTNDLFHEALARLLQGDRHAPRNLDFTLAVLGIMRSLADERRKQEAKWMLVGDEDPSEVDPDVLERLIQEELLLELQQRIGNDNTASDVLRLRAQGHTPDEICEALAIRKSTYDSANKRIRRAVLKDMEEDHE